MSEADSFGHLSADEKEALAAEAAATVNRTLAELFLRLGPPPGSADSQTQE
jgi:hypothetical protein